MLYTAYKWLKSIEAAAAAGIIVGKPEKILGEFLYKDGEQYCRGVGIVTKGVEKTVTDVGC